ncbi:MAG: TetR/AcrR family transcriptional regulator [Bacteroidota bacterium]
MGIAERRQREKEQRAKDIVDAAEKVIFSKGYEGATMDEIADAAELSKGTLYLYYKTKEELYFAIARRSDAILRKMALEAVHEEMSGLEKIIGMTQAYFRFYEEQRPYFDALHFMDTSTITREEMEERHQSFERSEGALQLLRDLIAQGVEDGSIRSDVDPVRQALLVWGQALGVIQILISKECMIADMFEVTRESLMESFYVTLRCSLTC